MGHRGRPDNNGDPKSRRIIIRVRLSIVPEMQMAGNSGAFAIQAGGLSTDHNR
jgi:hypothetical protein